MTTYYKWEDVQRELVTEDEIAASDERARRSLEHVRADSATETRDDSR